MSVASPKFWLLSTRRPVALGCAALPISCTYHQQLLWSSDVCSDCLCICHINSTCLDMMTRWTDKIKDGAGCNAPTRHTFIVHHMADCTLASIPAVRGARHKLQSLWTQHHNRLPEACKTDVLMYVC